MGQSTDAILAFGVNFGDESDAEEKLPWLAEKYQDTIDPLEAWWKEVGENPECPIEEIRHCHHEAPMFFVALKGARFEAHRGTPQIIDLDALHSLQDARRLAMFFEMYGIDAGDGNPHWQLMSYWG